MLTDHARRDSVLKYADVELERKRELMGRVIRIKSREQGKSRSGSLKHAKI